MRLDFNVLWVDDQPKFVEAQIKSIAIKMAAEGFEFNPHQCTTMDEVLALISDHVFIDEIDLILVDWGLGNNVYGEEVIDRVREIVRYKDVVFYSGEATVTELRQKAYEKGLEGVYCASRPELIDEVVGVFDSLIKKVLDLDHTRGIVMGATSDIDYMVNHCLTLAHGKLDDVGKAKFIEEALGKVAEQVEKLIKLGKKLEGSPSVEALFKAHMLFTSDHRLRLLVDVLGKEEFKAYSGSIVTVTGYRKDVVVDRNILGHAVLVPDGKPNSVVDGTGKVVNLDQMRELRKRILSLRADFRDLLNNMQT